MSILLYSALKFDGRCCIIGSESVRVLIRQDAKDKRERTGHTMKKLFCVLMALCMLLGGVALAQEAAGLEQDVVVLFTSDVHCGVE